MFRRIAMLMLVPLLAVLAACGSSSTTSAPTAAPAATSAPAATADAPAATSAPAATADAPTAATEATAAPATAATAAPSGSTGSDRIFVIVPDQTEASYEVQETFLQQNLPYTAVGKTNKVEGQFQFTTDGKPTGQVTRFVVDLSTLKSDSDRRDNAIRNNWLESSKFPNAEFTSTEVQGAPENYTEGQPVTFKLVGDMKIRDVTRPVTFDVTGTLQGDTVTGTATTMIMMKDFGFDPPNVAGVVSVQDGVKLNVKFTAKEQK